MSSGVDPGGPRSPLDDVAAELRKARLAAEAPSFGEIATRVSALRQARGARPEAARVGRTTVYDAFRDGRRRIDLALLRDIAEVLGLDAAEQHVLLARCQGEPTEQQQTEQQQTEQRTGQQAGARDGSQRPVVEVSERFEVAPLDAAGENGPEFAQVDGPEAPQPKERPRSGVEVPLPGPAGVRREGNGRNLPLLVGCVAVNLLGTLLVDILNLPIFLDMIGTALVAIVLGAWRGAAVGVMTNVLAVPITGEQSLLFIPIQVACAFVWAHGVRRWRMGRSLSAYLVLNVMVGCVATVLATPLIVVFLHGASGNGGDTIASAFSGVTHSLVTAVFSVNLLMSLIDKLLTGFIALALIETMPRSQVTSATPDWAGQLHH